MRNPLSLSGRSNVLLVSIVAFLVMSPIVEGTRTGGFFLTLILYVTLASATFELSAKPILLWSAIPLCAASMVLMMVSNYHPTKLLRTASFGVLAVFLLLVWVSLFAYLDRRSNLKVGKLSISICLYFVMGLNWYAIYSLINELDPGSFTAGGTPIAAGSDTSGLAYYSFVTLTTLGYGDILPMHPVARMAAALEAVAGVLYIAITVSRLVAAYGSEKNSADEDAGTA